MELRAYDVVVSLSVGKSQNYQKLRINYVTATSCVSWVSAVCVPANMYSYLKRLCGLSSYKTIRNNCFVVVNVTSVTRKYNYI